MGRMYTPGKGISKSAIPYRRTPSSWVKSTPEDVCEQICKLARKGVSPSQIGVVLRDSQGIPLVSSITGTKIVRILRANGLAPALPEDLYCLIKKAVSVRKHLSATTRTMMPSTASFLLSRASVVWPATTAPAVSWILPGNSKYQQHMHLVFFMYFVYISVGFGHCTWFCKQKRY
ncbi:ribosomal S13/S15 N-terminal domain-containing protein [Coemansia spiralis]|nr:ribosomal S13/S15 N-terminal domain-containing protein [Coemansia spiralis]